MVVIQIINYVGKFLKKYHKQISEKWYEFFVLNKTPKCRKITTKL